jgi:hypothetical protein
MHETLLDVRDDDIIAISSSACARAVGWTEVWRDASTALEEFGDARGCGSASGWANGRGAGLLDNGWMADVV